MSRRKYLDDYSIVEEYDPLTKRLKRKAVYIGKYFRPVHPEEYGKAKIFFTICVAAEILSHIAMLLINADCGKTWYTMMPLIFMVFPNLYLLMGLYRVLTIKEQVTREHKEKAADRMRTCSVVNLILSGLSLIGHIVFSIQGLDKIFGDWCFYPLTILVFLTSLLLIKNIGRIEMEEIESEKNASEEIESEEIEKNESEPNEISDSQKTEE